MLTCNRALSIYVTECDRDYEREANGCRTTLSPAVRTVHVLQAYVSFMYFYIVLSFVQFFYVNYVMEKTQYKGRTNTNK